MRNIAILSTDAEVNAIIERVCASFGGDEQEGEAEFVPAFHEKEEDFIQYLNYEFPEIDIVHYPDSRLQVQRALDAIKTDPWLHFGGSIIVYDTEVEEELQNRLAGINIIALIRRSRLEPYLTRVLNVLQQNRSILFQRDIHALLQSNLSGQFVIDNDPFDVTTYSNLLANFLYNSNLVNYEQKEDFYSAMVELLINAIEHGNCRITFEEKTKFLAHTPDILELVREKNEDPAIRARKVHVTYRITPQKSSFRIRDEGDGFDWRSRLQEARNESLDAESSGEHPGAHRYHGRGLLVADYYLEKLSYNDKGNEVSFEIDHLHHESNIVPGVFENQEEVAFEDGEVVFEQGDHSSHLYYIISGRFDIIAGGRTISTLSHADIFLGEMSFLLNNRRSARVVSRGRGVCMRISKENFINAIKNHPHYGIFLARLLAQRLDQLHDFTL